MGVGPNRWWRGGERGCDLFLYECNDCGAAVPGDATDRHDEFHKSLEKK